MAFSMTKQMTKTTYKYPIKYINGYSRGLLEEKSPKKAMIHFRGSTRTPYLFKFSAKSRIPPMVKIRNAQLKTPSKF